MSRVPLEAMMQARLAAGSRLKARATSSLTICLTSSPVTAGVRPPLTSTAIVLPPSFPDSGVGPDHAEHTVIAPRHASALHVGDEPLAGQAGPLQRRLVGALPEVARLGLAAAPHRRHVLHVDDPELGPVDLLPGVQLLAPHAVE